MKYKLNKFEEEAESEQKENLGLALKRLGPIMKGEGKNIAWALVAILITAGSALLAPIIIANTIDVYIQNKDYNGILISSGILLVVYIVSLVTQYIQTLIMGGVGRRVLYNLRNSVFEKVQELPLAFFNQNKSGDLISRINNDTDKLNQFFSQALMQFARNFFLILGAGIFLLVLDIRLGFLSLIPALIILIITRFISPWIKKRNLKNLQSLGSLSAEIQESLENFKVIAAFNRLDYFRNKFNVINEKNYSSAIAADTANNIFIPLYVLASNLAQLIVLAYGIYFITTGSFTIGLLIGFLLYVSNFYAPLQQLASVWSSLQLALAALDRISDILALESDMETTAATKSDSKFLLEFKGVSFGYLENQNILQDINIGFEKGKTYALVGPTGGGKTTAASLMARLYDPTKGLVLLDGKDIRSYHPEERVRKIGFIAQDPFLFTGTVKENIIYGNPQYQDYSSEALKEVIKKENLNGLLDRFEEGLETKVSVSASTLSLGQKQLIAFIRAVLRNPELLILDEATANIDTVTEELLEVTLNKLSPSTTKVIIAHRLNTIKNADEIYFVNSGKMLTAGSMEHAVDLLLHGRRQS